MANLTCDLAARIQLQSEGIFLLFTSLIGCASPRSCQVHIIRKLLLQKAGTWQLIGGAEGMSEDCSASSPYFSPFFPRHTRHNRLHTRTERFPFASAVSTVRGSERSTSHLQKIYADGPLNVLSRRSLRALILRACASAQTGSERGIVQYVR